MRKPKLLTKAFHFAWPGGPRRHVLCQVGQVTFGDTYGAPEGARLPHHPPATAHHDRDEHHDQIDAEHRK